LWDFDLVGHACSITIRIGRQNNHLRLACRLQILKQRVGVIQIPHQLALAAIHMIRNSHFHCIGEPKQQQGMKSPDSLTKTTKKGEIELTEEELARVPGGCGTGMSKIQTD
jgi:type III secretory pathway component EscR